MGSIKRYPLGIALLVMMFSLGSSAVFALGVGEVRLLSRLHQPLHAEVALSETDDFNATEIFSSLASRDDFQKAGVQRPYSLLDLRFKTQVRPDGTGIIKVTSTKPIQEPFVNFLLEVHWPNGRLLREYTLLLDPPVLSDPIPPTVNTPVVRGPRTYALPEVRGRVAPASRPDAVDPAAPQYPAVDSGTSTGEMYKVRRNDNLWYIADDLRPDSGVSVEQTMMALLRMNPDAFVGHNINRLKKGVVLRVPDSDTVRSLTHKQAAWQVAMHHKAWKQNTQLPQLDATRREYSEPRHYAQAQPPSGRLSIVAPDATVANETRDNSGEGEQVSNLQNELLMTREQVDQLSRDNSELTSKLQDLDDQLSTLNKLMMLKDDQLAALQASQEENTSEVKPDSETLEKEKAVDTQSVEATPYFWEEFSVPDIDITLPEISFESINNPVLLGLIALLPILGAAGFIYRRRRQENAGFDDDDLLDSLDLAGGQSDEQDTDNQAAAESDDPVTMADTHVSYGRFSEAAQGLTAAIKAAPDDAALQLKRLEVYADANDLEGFKAGLVQLEALGNPDAMKSAEVLKVRFDSDAFSEKASETLVEEEDGFPSLDELDLDLDLDLDDDSDTSETDALAMDSEPAGLDFSMDEDLGVDEPSESEPAALDEANSLDFDMGGSVTPEEAPVETEAEQSESAPSLDFSAEGLNFSPTAPESAPTEETDGVSPDFGDAEAGIDDDLAFDDDFDGDMSFLSGDDEVGIKLDLARAYIDMGDNDGASDILDEVIDQGSQEQQAEAKELMEQL